MLDFETEELLKEIIENENGYPEILRRKFQSVKGLDSEILRAKIRRLIDEGYISKIQWADNLPYSGRIEQKGRTYFETKKKVEMLSKLVKEAVSKIFISHRAVDKDFADILADFLFAIGVPRDKVFCSSLPGNDVNENIPKEVKESLQNSCLNIAILSSDYYKSAYCLNEAGVFWIQNTPIITIGLPEISQNNMVGFLDSYNILRRFDVETDIAHICDIVCDVLDMKQPKSTALTTARQKLENQYKSCLNKRKTTVSNEVEVEIDDVTTDDEKVLLYYIAEKNIRKIKKISYSKWLQYNEIYDIDIDNAFDLLSCIGNGALNNDELELDIKTFRKYSKSSQELKDVLYSSVKKHTKRSSDAFNKLWERGDLDEDIKLFLAYRIDERVSYFGSRWKADEQVANIKEWESKHSLILSTLSENYGTCLSYFIENGFVYENEWTSHGNAREYALCESLKKLLFEENDSFISELIKVKKDNYSDLPF